MANLLGVVFVVACLLVRHKPWARQKIYISYMRCAFTCGGVIPTKRNFEHAQCGALQE